MRIDCESAAIHDLSIVEQARDTNKELSFGGIPGWSAVEWLHFSQGAPIH